MGRTKRAKCWAIQRRAVHHVACWLVMSVGCWLVVGCWSVGGYSFFSMEKSKHTGRFRFPLFSFPFLSLSLFPPSTRTFFSSGMCEKKERHSPVDFLHRIFEKPQGNTRCVLICVEGFEKEGTSRSATFGWDRRRSPDVVFEHNERCLKQVF